MLHHAEQVASALAHVFETCTMVPCFPRGVPAVCNQALGRKLNFHTAVLATILSYTTYAMSVLVCFIDGLGLTDPAQPPWTTARLPTLRGLLGAVPTSSLIIDQPALAFRPIDATLGVPGLPQSGTGHTTLWTGVNAAARLGRHYPAYPAPSQRSMIAEHSLFRRCVAAGFRVQLATVHRTPYWELVAQRKQRATAAAFAAQAANLDLPTPADFKAGWAVPWDITGQFLQRWDAFDKADIISPQAAGQRLAQLTSQSDLVHYECYLPDFVGHGRIEAPAELVLELIDAMLAGVLAHLPAHAALIVVSDHGNIEEHEHHRHTFNPVPLLATGAAAPFAASVRALDDVATLIERTLHAQANT